MRLPPTDERAPGRWPTRRTLALCFLALVLFAWYSSLIPFAFRPVPLGQAMAQLEQALAHPPPRPPRADFAANAFFFGLVGYCLSGALSLDRGRWPRAGLAVLASGGVLCLGLALEFAEVFFVGRVVSGWDVMAAALGGALGGLAWVVVGQTLLDWIRSTATDGPADWLLRVVTLYAIGFAITGVMPFDPTLDVGALASKYRAGRIVLVPFGAPLSLATLLWDGVWTMAAAVPIGMLVAAAATRRRPQPGLLAVTAAGWACVAVIECAQVFLPSRWADVTDVLFGGMGVAAGAAATFRWLHRPLAPLGRATGPGRVDRRMLSLALAAWGLAVVLYHWYPLHFVMRYEVLRERLRSLSWIPLTGYFHSAPFVAFDQFFTKLALAAPLGVMVERRLRTSRGSTGRIRTVSVGVMSLCFFAAIEAGQVLLPGRVPDVGDVLIGTAGLLLGLVLSARVARVG